MVSVWWLSCSRSRLSGKGDRCALVPLGVPQQGGEGGSWISPHGSADASAWVGRAGQGQGYSLPANSAGGTKGEGGSPGGIFGTRNVLGSVVSGIRQCMGVAGHPTHVLVVFHLYRSGTLRTVFWDGDRSLKASLPSWRSVSCREAEHGSRSSGWVCPRELSAIGHSSW